MDKHFVIIAYQYTRFSTTEPQISLKSISFNLTRRMGKQTLGGALKRSILLHCKSM
jgi:hypothetical protein